MALSVQYELTVHAVVQHLTGKRRLTKEAQQQAAEVLNDMLAQSLATKVAIVAGRKRAGEATRQGRPAATYIVELESAWQKRCTGAIEMDALVNATLTEHGARAASKASIVQAVHRSGTWWRNIETADGAYALTVRKE